MKRKMSAKELLYEDPKDPYLIWLKKSKGLSPNTIYLYNWYYEKFKELEKIDQENIDNFVQQYKNNYVVRGFLRSFFDYAEVKDKYNLIKKKSGNIRKRKIRNYSKKDINYMLKKAYEKDNFLGLALNIIYHGALRVSELPKIKVNHFYWNEFFKDPKKPCKLHIFGKGKMERIVLVSPITINDILTRLLKNSIISKNMNYEEITQTLNSKDLYLFQERIYEWRIWKFLREISQKTIGTSMRTHELRHTKATHLLKDGASIKSIQLYLGHSSLQITQIYLHSSQEEALEEIEGMIE